MNDSSLVPFGEHKGSKLIDVHFNYLIWIYENNRCGNSELKDYIKDNLEVLKLQSKNKK